MLRTKLLLTLVVGVFFFLVGVPLSVTSSDEPVKIAPFYQCAHDLKGVVYALNEKQIMITGFDYDGKGPGAWFHGQLRGAKGVYSSEPDTFVTLPFPKETCDRLEVGKRYSDENVTLTLPRPIKDFQTIGILCYQFCHNFGHVFIPENFAAPVAPADLPEHKACPTPEYKGCTIEGTRNSAIHPSCSTGEKGRTTDSAATIQSLHKILIGLPLLYLLCKIKVNILLEL